MNNLRIRLTALGLAIFMATTPMALSGCSHDSSIISSSEQSENNKKTISNNKEAYSNDLIKDLYPNYTKEFGSFKKYLELPTDFFESTEVLYLLKNIIDNEDTEEPILFENEGDLYYTSDKSVCYDKSSNRLQFACKEKGLNVLKEVFIPKQGTIMSSEYPGLITTIVTYNENGDNIEYNALNENINQERFRYKHITSTELDGTPHHKCMISCDSNSEMSSYTLYNYDDSTKAWLSLHTESIDSLTVDNLHPEAIHRFNSLFDSYESEELETLITNDLPKTKTYKLN